MGPRIHALLEGFLRGRYGYEGDRALRVLAVPVLIGAILVAGWLLLGPSFALLTIPRISSEGPVVRNGVAAVMVCGKKRGTVGSGLKSFKGLEAATDYAPEPRTGTWGPVQQGECTIWYHHPPGFEQRYNRQERARREQTSNRSNDEYVRACERRVLAEYRDLPAYRDLARDFARGMRKDCGIYADRDISQH